MSRPPKRENKPANLECLNCGHHFIAVVPQMGHYVAEIPQPVKWVVSSTDSAACPSCGSDLVEEKHG
jgi:Zn finger protein HypA/HybF involved in hydrogenase expression